MLLDGCKNIKHFRVDVVKAHRLEVKPKEKPKEKEKPAGGDELGNSQVSLNPEWVTARLF